MSKYERVIKKDAVKVVKEMTDSEFLVAAMASIDQQIAVSQDQIGAVQKRIMILTMRISFLDLLCPGLLNIILHLLALCLTTRASQKGGDCFTLLAEEQDGLMMILIYVTPQCLSIKACRSSANQQRNS